ncbi:MAG: peptide ABC transporter ATP-binding protein, partial [Candidatus Electrothrix sp. AR4]|nr:peptide ABC transporter ATP-binding protein [Candidatus Electrothrix sp. AR4]
RTEGGMRSRQDTCRTITPDLTEVEPGHFVACQ